MILYLLTFLFINRKGNVLSIPPGWLCYLAPEIVRRLKPQENRDQEELPFTEASDVYAFGLVEEDIKI